MKTIGRLLILILVIGIVTAGLYFLVENGSSSTAGFDPRFEGGFDGRDGGGLPPGVVQGNRPPRGRFEGDHEGGERGALSLGRGLVGIFGNLIQIGVITFLVVGLQRLLARKGSSKPDSA